MYTVNIGEFHERPTHFLIQSKEDLSFVFKEEEFFKQLSAYCCSREFNIKSFTTKPNENYEGSYITTLSMQMFDRPYDFKDVILHLVKMKNLGE